MQQKTCRCGSNIPNKICCNAIINGTMIASSPEQLMRSRYTAFCLKNVAYLAHTYHDSKRPSDYASSLASRINDTQWVGLKIIQSGVNPNDPKKGFVEFIAYHIDAAASPLNVHSNNVKQLHEHSHFTKENHEWFYLEGDYLPPTKFQRNDPCWCNSGQKIKKCHGC
jgi:SEC-C motif-containing protein